MESININLKNNKKRLIINEDENKILEFNPNDMKTRKNFYNASKEVFNKQREFDIRIKQLKADDYEKAFELEQELFDMLKNIVDNVFGKGTTEMITDGAIDVTGVCNFIVAIAPYFKEVNEAQKNKYTNNLKSAGLI